MNPAFGKIAVLCGGRSCEREVSLVSGRAVVGALAAAGFEVISMDPADEGYLDALKRERPAIAFLALHGTYGEDGTIQRALEKAGIPYTGSGPEASERAFDKATTQTLLRQKGLPVPDFVILNSPADLSAAQSFGVPQVVKPARAGSSVGISIVQDPSDIAEACREAFRHSERVLVERYTPGRELTVGILGDEALPVGEIIPQRSFYDYQAKYGDSGTRYEFPARLSREKSDELRRLALAAHRAAGCEAMSRVDLMLSREERPYLLEINTIPGLTSKSLLPKAAGAAGIDFTGLCVKIIELSMTRAENAKTV